MTNDYKKQLLDYITGNITTGTSSLNSFKSGEEITNNFVQQLHDKGIYTVDYRVISTNTTTNYLIYGNYTNSSSVKAGFIVILNQNSEIVKILTEFDTGTTFGKFLTLDFDENGNIYGIDFYNNQHRIILLNNVALKTTEGFYCKLRASYYIDETTFKVLEPISLRSGGSSIKKAINQASYYILGQSSTNVMLCEFKINVGSQNEWNFYTGDSIQNGEKIYKWNILLSQSGDNNVAYICYQTDYYSKKLFYDYFNGSSLTRTATYDIDENIDDFKIKNSTKIYVSGISSLGSYYKVGFYEINNGVITTIEEFNSQSNESYSDYLISIVNNLVFTEKIYFDSNINKYNLICSMYDEENYISSETYIDDFIILNCEVKKTFSLYKFIIQTNTKSYNPAIVVYDNAYSGGAYSDYDSLIPSHSELYDGNNIIFARNLYNKNILNNTTTSILEVPFNYINDIPITNQSLLGETQIVLVNNANTITKNIYENLFINFINNINVIDEDTGTKYPVTANYINININIGTQTNMNNTAIGKIRINYTDTTTKTLPIVWTKLNDFNCSASISLYVDKDITTIDFISNDETTIYCTKEIEVTTGKYYTITQKLRTGEPIT